MIPWRSIGDWHEANQSIRDIIDRRSRSLGGARKLAVEIQLRCAALYPMMDIMGQRFCANCTNPCCRIATVWYDYADLIFMHLNQLLIPKRQSSNTAGAGCDFLGPRGCTLTRWVRPWICTWYLCPDQMDYLRSRFSDEIPRFFQQRDRIKKLRRIMEDRFIWAITR